MPRTIDRRTYADLFGPTTGDSLRLADTDLWLCIEKDLTTYGDECKFGGGKVLRDGMGQASGVSQADALDCVITGAIGLAIGAAKAALVVLFFMQAVKASRLTWAVVAVTGFWVVLLFGLTLTDFLSRGLVPHSPGH